ncbi:(2Fe-2S) ferredoxin domain-containing protein [Streptomyces sp. NPDC086554]|uniref:(2Fe-2S) ferredoxin domain-containing protein n=1 Tax=Streptomyces sp. NPDC086554 TaxID=3154864 RepID=UPI00343FA9EA
MNPRTTHITAARRRPCTLVVCRGCCCGSPRKHLGTDHACQLDRLRAAAASSDRLTVRTSDCLGPCDQADVIVVQPSTAGRSAGGRTIWIGFALDDEATDDLLNWVAAGGPGIAAPPPTLQPHFIRPPRETRTRARR